MAKENPNTKAKAPTPFQKFQALARKIVKVPKSRMDKARDTENKPQVS